MTYYRMRANSVRGFERYSFKNNGKALRIAKRLDRSQWALAFIGAVVGAVDYKDGHNKWYTASRVVDIAGNGKYLKLKMLNHDGTDSSIKPRWAHSYLWYRATDTLREYVLERQLEELNGAVDNATVIAQRETAEKLSLLSQNTVTRALVHAYQNDYCSETAVALISAGHKMPDVTLDFEVTLSVSVTLDGNDNYYPLRELFGTTDGNVEGDSGNSHIEGHDKVWELVSNEIANGDYDKYSSQLSHTGTSVDWGTPVLRMTQAYEINAN